MHKPSILASLLQVNMYISFVIFSVGSDREACSSGLKRKRFDIFAEGGSKHARKSITQTHTADQACPTGESRRHQAMKDGVTLKHHRDFILYMATVSGGYALRYVMIPHLIDSLRELGPSDDIMQAFVQANEKIKNELKGLDPASITGQLPKVEFTSSKKFCIGKQFPPAKD